MGAIVMERQCCDKVNMSCQGANRGESCQSTTVVDRCLISLHRVGIEYAELKRLLGDAVVGLHSMVDEHFGISVVEYMAAGRAPQETKGLVAVSNALLDANRVYSRQLAPSVLVLYSKIPAGVVPIAHNSGGPARDIVPVPGGRAGSGADAQRCGYLCSSEEEYVEALTRVLIMPQTERLKMAAEGRRCVVGEAGMRVHAPFIAKERGKQTINTKIYTFCAGTSPSFQTPTFGNVLRRRCGRCCNQVAIEHGYKCCNGVN